MDVDPVVLHVNSAAVLFWAQHLWAGGGILGLGSWIGGVPFRLVGRYAFFLWFCMAGTMAVVVHRRLSPCAVGYLAGFLLAMHGVLPRYLLMAATHLVLLINVLVVWESGTDTRTPPRSRKR